MKKSIVSLPGCQVHEYLLVLSPSEELWQQILTIKKQFAATYNASLAYAKPHITLIKFEAYQMKEESIINKFGMIGSGIRPFEVELRDFGSFSSRTIYINVTTKDPIQNLVKELKQIQHLLSVNGEARPYFCNNPHVTICRGLNSLQYEKAWLDYSHGRFSGQFIADSMMLLKWSYSKNKYEAIMRFEFRGVSMLAKQASLFM